jgi:ribonucleoside-diphosphate reductase beta chain
MKHYSQVFGPVEVQMMLSAFSNIETVHIAAYSRTCWIRSACPRRIFRVPEIQGNEGQVRLHAGRSTWKSRRDIAKDDGGMFGAFTEGLQLFASPSRS